LSRQNLPILDNSSADSVNFGAYIAEDTKDAPEAIIISTGSEVYLALEAARSCKYKTRVVSAPCLELFDRQSLEYRRKVLPIGVPIISVEAQGPVGWARYSHHSIAIQAWGASAPYERIYEEYGFTGPKICAAVEKFIQEAKQVGAFGVLRCQY